MSEETLERLFGRNFVERYKKALAAAREIPKEKLEEYRRLALTSIKDSVDFRLKCDSFDILFVQAPRDTSSFPIKQTKAGNYKVTLIWAGSKSLRNQFVSVFLGAKDDAEKLLSKPEKVWILVGKLRERTYEGDLTYSFNCFGIIDLEAL
jgi:hypothetical protein